MDIVQFRGEVMPYLTPVPGRASLKVFDMARDGLATELQVMLAQAREQNVRVRRGGLSIMQDNVARRIALEITPFTSLQNGERFFLVEFVPDEMPTPQVPSAGGPVAGESAYLAQIAQLRQDLEATRNYLQSTIEKHETTNQDLRAANEEIQSSNEELQSTNEELETAKEELQSTNEELSTVNDELHHRHVALIQANNDLTNLIASVHLPILILSQDLTIRRFTPAAEKVFNVIPSDVGRPLTDINTNLAVKDLADRVRQTVDTLAITEIEVRDTRGHWYALRLRPYKTSDNKIEGVVVTLIDIDELKRAVAAMEASRDFERAVFETTREPLVALDSDLRIRSANRAFYRLFGLERETPESRSFLDATNDRGGFGELKKALNAVLSDKINLMDQPVSIQLPDAQRASFLLNARQIVGEKPYQLILLSLHRV
jgi:two-component system CheB/CheR fusion protein